MPNNPTISLKPVSKRTSTGPRHGHPAHRYLSAIPAWQSRHLSSLRHGQPTHRYLRAIPTCRTITQSLSNRPLTDPDRSSPRPPCPQVLQCHPHVPNNPTISLKPASKRTSTGPRHSHPTHRYLSAIPTWQSRHLSSLRHGHPAHKYLRGIPAWQSRHLSSLRHGHPVHRYLSGIPTCRTITQSL